MQLEIIVIRIKVRKCGFRTVIRMADFICTKMVIILSTICFTTRLIEAIAGVFVRLVFLDVYEFTDEFKSRIMLFNDLSLMLDSADACARSSQ